jgi:ATP-binding cassette, subfamily B, bacterial
MTAETTAVRIDSAPRSRLGELEIYRRLLAQARPQWAHLVGILLISLTSTPIALLTPLPLKVAVDSVLGEQPLPAFLAPLIPSGIVESRDVLIILLALAVVVIALLTYLQSMALWVLQTYTAERLTLEFRARLFGHLQRLSLAFHDRRGTGDSTYRLQYDTTAIGYAALSGLIPVLTAVTTLAAMVVVAWQINPVLAVVALSIMPVLLLIIVRSRKRLRTGWEDVKQHESAAMSVAHETLGAIRIVRAFGQEERQQARFVERWRSSMLGQVRVAFLQARFDLVVGLTIASATALTLLVGINGVMAGTMTAGDMLLVLGYMAMIYQPLSSITKTAAATQSAVASADRVFRLLDEQPDVQEKADALPLDRARGWIRFDEVSFAYEPGQPVLSGIHLDVSPGTTVGIQGVSGAGKTTFVNLLTRFFDPTTGRILLDGVDLRDYRLDDLRRQFAIVLQEPVLFSTTIAENIAYARPDATTEEIIEAARAAEAHEFIERLPDGYETIVGERGMTVSGGERQRISIARAFLRDAPVLILDEPTSAVDLETEAAIMRTFERLMRGRTTFLIAHRLSTLERCDMRLELDAGRLHRSMTGARADG